MALECTHTECLGLIAWNKYIRNSNIALYNLVNLKEQEHPGDECFPLGFWVISAINLQRPNRSIAANYNHQLNKSVNMK